MYVRSVSVPVLLVVLLKDFFYVCVCVFVCAYVFIVLGEVCVFAFVLVCVCVSVVSSEMCKGCNYIPLQTPTDVHNNTCTNQYF